jgi:hypothetical protein
MQILSIALFNRRHLDYKHGLIISKSKIVESVFPEEAYT